MDRLSNFKRQIRVLNKLMKFKLSNKYEHYLAVPITSKSVSILRPFENVKQTMKEKCNFNPKICNIVKHEKNNEVWHSAWIVLADSEEYEKLLYSVNFFLREENMRNHIIDLMDSDDNVRESAESTFNELYSRVTSDEIKHLLDALNYTKYLANNQSILTPNK